MSNYRNDIEDIICNPPNWILKWGITTVALTVTICLFLAWFIKYPDLITAPVLVTTERPAIRVITPIGGVVEAVLSKNHSTVKQDQDIILFNNPAKWNDIKMLKKITTNLLKLDQSISSDLPQNNLCLGELQSSYNELITKLNQYEYLLREEGTIKKKTINDRQKLDYDLINKSLEDQIVLLKEELEIAEKDFEISKQLYKSGASNFLEVEASEKSILQYKRQLKTLESQIIGNRLSIEQIEMSSINIEQDKRDNINNHKLLLKELIHRTQDQIKTWEEKYLMKAPINGELLLSRIWTSNQFINPNTEAFVIIPENGFGDLLIKAKVSSQNIGKIKTGMVANINLNEYPQQEYGTLKSKIKYISAIPNSEGSNNLESEYIVEFELVDGLKTSYNTYIEVMPEMSGMIEIVTNEKSVLDRILMQLKDIL